MTDHDSSTHDSARQDEKQALTPDQVLELVSNCAQGHIEKRYRHVTPEDVLILVNNWEKIGDQWIADAKKKANQLRDAANQFAAANLANSEGDDQRWLASILYWNASKYIRAETIAQAVGVKSGQTICKWVYPQVAEVTCSCGQVFKSPYSSRASAAPSDHLCPQCREKQTHYWQDEAAKREREYQALRAMPYSEYLKTDHWQQVRAAALKRAGYRCQVCNTNEKSLHVHHRTYEHRGQEYARDVIVLCADCHRLFHESGQLAG